MVEPKSSPRALVARVAVACVGERGDETFDLSAAGLRADGTDLAISVEVLAAKLEQALPGPHARRAPRRRPARPRREARAPDRRSSSARQWDQLSSWRSTASASRAFASAKSGGIAIKREPLDPDAVDRGAHAELQAEAQRSAERRRSKGCCEGARVPLR